MFWLQEWTLKNINFFTKENVSMKMREYRNSTAWELQTSYDAEPGALRVQWFSTCVPWNIGNIFNYLLKQLFVFSACETYAMK